MGLHLFQKAQIAEHPRRGGHQRFADVFAWEFRPLETMQSEPRLGQIAGERRPGRAATDNPHVEIQVCQAPIFRPLRPS